MDQSPLAIHHVGVAVPSIDDAMHFYGDTLGLSLVDSLELADRQLKVAFVQTANMLIELLEPTDPNSTVSRFLERRGPGLHHLCFGTPDIRRHLRDLQDKGVELIDAAPRPGAHGEVAFLQPYAALGVLVELIQPTDGTPATSEPTPAADTAPAEASHAGVSEGTVDTAPAEAPSAAAAQGKPEAAGPASGSAAAEASHAGGSGGKAESPGPASGTAPEGPRTSEPHD
jgi:methylmalonyl-CoA/ethylmalonyl-CoA epimerase